MNKIQEIFKAWQIAYNPNDLQSALAIDRMQICDSCDSKKETPFIHCGECMCALKAKIYTPKIGACPRGKWVAVEMKWENQKNRNAYDSVKNNKK
jgi:hypothetical protein